MIIVKDNFKKYFTEEGIEVISLKEWLLGGEWLMNKDITLPYEDGIVNLRVDAINQKDGKILKVGNKIRPE